MPLNELHRELEAVSPDLPARTDELLRGILAGSGDCIKILDLEGRLQFMSEGGKRIMEVDNFAALQNCPWPDLWQGEGNAQAMAAVTAARAGEIFRFRGGADTAKGTHRHWDVQVSPIRGPDGAVTQLLSISRDITEEWTATETLRKNSERQKFLTEELTHRVKNTLATVLGLASQTFRGEAHKEPLAKFNGRVQSLSDAYRIMDANWSVTAIQPVVEAALTPYRTGLGRISVSGPAYDLLPNQALTLALSINELSTNAIKYGALSVAEGRVAIAWSVDTNFEFEWRESDGPGVVPPSRAGFGSRLIKSLLAHDFGGTVDLIYEPSGLVCKLTAPIKS